MNSAESGDGNQEQRRGRPSRTTIINGPGIQVQISRAQRGVSGPSRPERRPIRIHPWAVLAEWVTGTLAVGLLSFYFYTLSTATKSDREETAYLLLLIYTLMSAYMRVCYLLSLIGKTYVLKTQGPGEVAELPHQRLIDAVGSLLFIVEPGHFVALCWITHYCFPMKPCTEMGFQSGMICLAFHMISTIFVTCWICTLIAIAALVAGVVFAAPTLRRRRNDRQGLAAALQMAPIPDQFREQLVNQLPVTHVAPEDAAADAAAGAGLCAICFEEEAESAWRLLPCGHRFHPACVDEWLKKRGGTCPTCRHDPALGETGFTGAAAEDAPPPPLVLSGHAASLTPY